MVMMDFGKETFSPLIWMIKLYMIFETFGLEVFSITKIAKIFFDIPMIGLHVTITVDTLVMPGQTS